MHAEQFQPSESSHLAVHDVTATLQKEFPGLFVDFPDLSSHILASLQQSQGNDDQAHTVFVTSLTKIEQLYQSRIEEIGALEKKLADGQNLALINHRSHDEDVGRAFSPFLRLNKDNHADLRDRNISSIPSIGDFIDWKTVKDAGLAGPQRGTFKPPSAVKPLRQSMDSSPKMTRHRKRNSLGKSTGNRAVRRARRTCWPKSPTGYSGKIIGAASLRFNPSILRIRNYVPGGIYEVPCEVVNVGSGKNLCRLDAVKSSILDIHSPSSSSYLASGMSVRYIVEFKPNSYLPIIDRIDVRSIDGTRSTICIHARNDPPKLCYLRNVDIGTCVTNSVTVATVKLTNAGDHGIFYVMRGRDFTEFDPATNEIVDSARFLELTSGCCTITPALFEISPHGIQDLQFEFRCPHDSAGHFLEEFSIVGHLGHVFRLTVSATIVSSPLCFEKSIPEMATVNDDHFCHVDLSAQKVAHFRPNYPGKTNRLEWTLRNISDMDLIYNFRNRIPKISSEMGVLHKTNLAAWDPPSRELFPIHQISPSRLRVHASTGISTGELMFGALDVLTFAAEHCLDHVGSDRTVIQMVITGMVCRASRWLGLSKKVTLNQPAVFFAIDVSSSCVPIQLVIPEEVVLRKKLTCGRKARSTFSIMNKGPAPVSVTLENFLDSSETVIRFPVHSHTIEGESTRSLRFTLTSVQLGKHTASLACRVTETGLAHVITVKFTVKGARLKFNPYVKMGGIMVGEERHATLTLANPTHLPANWSLTCTDRKLRRILQFCSSFGCIPPGRSKTVRVTVFNGMPLQMTAKCSLEVQHGMRRSLWVMAHFQHQDVTIIPLCVELDKLHFELEDSLEFTVLNNAALLARLTWATSFADCTHLQLAEPPCAILLNPLEKRQIRIKIRPVALGKFRDALLTFYLNGEVLAVAKLSGQVAGPSLRIFYCEGNSLTEFDRKCGAPAAYSNDISLENPVKLNFIVRNETPLPVKFTASCQNFPSNWQPEESVTERMRIAALFSGEEVPPKFKPMRITVSAVNATVPTGEVSLTLTVTASMFGIFEEVLVIEVDNSSTLRIALRFHVTNSPIHFCQTESQTNELPLTRFSIQAPNGPPEVRQISVRNILPYTVTVNWLTALRSDSPSHTFGCVTDFEKVPFISSHLATIGFPEVEGTPDQTIFSAEPPCLDIGPNSTGTIWVKFDPSELRPDVRYDGILVGHAKIRDHYKRGTGEPYMNGTYAPAIRMLLHAATVLSRLRVDVASDQLLFSMPAGDILRAPTDAPACSNLSFRLINCQNTVLKFRLATPAPFAVCGLTGKTYSNGRLNETAIKLDDGDGWYRTEPQVIIKVDLSFSLRASELTAILRKHGTEKDLDIRAPLRIYYPSVEESKEIPLHAVVLVPRLAVSRTAINFGTCRIQTQYEQVFQIHNFTRSRCPWRLECSAGSCSDFVLSHQKGEVVARDDLSGKEVEISVQFTPMRNVEQSTEVLCYGLMDELFARIRLSGRGVMDYGQSGAASLKVLHCTRTEFF